MLPNPDRKCHILKQTKTAKYPSNFLFFDTETKGNISPLSTAESRQTFWFGHALAFRYESGRRTRVKSYVLHSIEKFWTFVRSRLDKSRPLFVLAHNIGFDLTVMDFWHLSDDLGIDVKYVVMETPPTYIESRWDGSTLMLVDTLNYYRSSLKELGESVGMIKGDMSALGTSLKDWHAYCRQDVEIIATTVTKMIDFFQANDLGKWQLTQASMALSCFKHRFMSHEVFIHDNQDVLEIERKCYYGGMVQCYYIGSPRGGNCYKLDINSQYPAAMLNSLPVKYLRKVSNPPEQTIPRYRSQYGICASIVIDSPTIPYIKLEEGRLCEITGKFRTYLCGPEFWSAWDNGHISSIDAIYLYDMEFLCKDFVNFFWEKRLEYAAKGDEVGRYFTKILLNSLYGKFAQKGHDWQPLSEFTLRQLYVAANVPYPKCYRGKHWIPSHWTGTFRHRFLGLEGLSRLRSTQGSIEICMEDQEHTVSSPIIAAYVTAYARERLRALIKTAGKRQVYYCDTDSLFTTELGYQRLIRAGEMDPKTIGKLKLEGTDPAPTFYGLKDYDFGGEHKIKGVRGKALQIDETTFLQNQFQSLKTVFNELGKETDDVKREPYIAIKWITKVLTRDYAKGTVTPSGWVVPFNIIESV